MKSLNDWICSVRNCSSNHQSRKLAGFRERSIRTVDTTFADRDSSYIRDKLDKAKTKENRMSDFKQYRRKQIAELRPFEEGETLSERVSISAPDKEAGSPKVGDMIARNPANHDDQWLVAEAYFLENFAPLY